MGRPQRMRARAWLACLLGVGAVYAALALRAGKPGVASTEDEPADVADPRDPALAGDPRMAQARKLIRGADGDTPIVAAYGAWAGEPAALPARRLLLKSLFRDEGSPFGVSSALAAIEADPTPPERDPLWNQLVEWLSNSWQGPRIARGLDLMVAESRPRARRAVIASFAHLVIAERTSDLSPEQRQTLTNHLIDLAPSMAPAQQPEIDQALRLIASDDVADIMLGRGLDSDDALDGARERKRALAETQRELAHMPPAESP